MGRKIKNPYQANETMKLLGKQTLNMQITHDEELKEILSANKSAGYSSEETMILTMLDAFKYGLIIGKRMERAKRRERKQEEE